MLLPASAVNYEAWFGHEYHISTVSNLPYVIHLHSTRWGRRGCDRMVVGFIATCAISAYHHYNCEFEPRSWRGVLDTTLFNKVCQ